MKLTQMQKALVAWAVILAIMIGAAALYGGRNCEVPRSGPFHSLLKSHKFVKNHVGRLACRQVK